MTDGNGSSFTSSELAPLRLSLFMTHDFPVPSDPSTITVFLFGTGVVVGVGFASTIVLWL